MSLSHTQYEIGDCIILKNQISGFEHILGLEIEDFQLDPPQFLSKHNTTLTELLEKNKIEIYPYHIMDTTTAVQRKQRFVVANPEGKVEKIFVDDILMKGKFKVTMPMFERWNLFSLVEQGEPRKCPLHPKYDGTPSAYYYDSCWYALKEKTPENRFVTAGNKMAKAELEMMCPQLSFDEIPEENIKLILDLPGVDNWKPKSYKNRRGIGYQVIVPTKKVKYSGSPWMNRTASNGVQTKSVVDTKDGEEVQHFYIPLERLRPVFQPNESNLNKAWYAINWCITSFRRFFPKT